MANNGQDNLIPLNERTKEEQREIARQGGIASGKARQKKATFKKTLEMILDEEYKDGKTYREMITLGQIKGAIDGKAENFKALLGLAGELEEEKTPQTTPILQIEIVNNEELEKNLYDDN